MPGSWKEITIEYNGKIINGDYKIAGKTVIVKTVRGMKEAPLSGPTPLYWQKCFMYLAKMLCAKWRVREGPDGRAG
jgi:hypothetical protein